MKRALLFLLKSQSDLPAVAGFESTHVLAQSPNSAHALQALSDGAYDGVIADIEFQHDAEISFFDQVMNRQPKVSRLALCNPEGRRPVVSANSIHQYLSRPCTLEDIDAAVERSRLMDRWLLDLQFNRLYKLLKKLPSVPAIYFRLMKEMQSGDADLESVGKIVSEDPALTAQVLKVVNSAYFGLQRTITSTMEAVSFLGIERTKALSLITHTFGQFGSIQCPGFSIDQLWHHAVKVASIAQAIAREESGKARMAEEAFTAGVLHDVGKLMVAVNLPEEFKRVTARMSERGESCYAAEGELLGASHAEIGACMMGSWSLPPRIVEAIAFHHAPEKYFDKGFNPALAVHVANAFLHGWTPKDEKKANASSSEHLNLAQLESLGLKDRLPAWHELAGELDQAA